MPYKKLSMDISVNKHPSMIFFLSLINILQRSVIFWRNHLATINSEWRKWSSGLCLDKSTSTASDRTHTQVHVIVCFVCVYETCEGRWGDRDQTAIFLVISNHMSEYNYVWNCREQKSFPKQYVPFQKREAEQKWGVMLEQLRNTSSAVVLWARHRALFLCSQ